MGLLPYRVVMLPVLEVIDPGEYVLPFSLGESTQSDLLGSQFSNFHGVTLSSTGSCIRSFLSVENYTTEPRPSSTLDHLATSATKIPYSPSRFEIHATRRESGDHAAQLSLPGCLLKLTCSLPSGFIRSEERRVGKECR